MTGYSLTGDSTAGWVASAVSDENGTIDYDGDGDLDEINTGCEVCHGPGSEHVAAAGAGTAIVHPGLMTPERESMICGRCHSRPKGALGTDVPDNASGALMMPGSSRSEFLTNYTNGVQYDTNLGSDLYGDKDQHSKSHHQQYTDFIRSRHYNNQEQLLSCANCHNMHGTENYRSLVATTSDNALCTDCHSDKLPITNHTRDRLGVETDMGVLCVDCHMQKMAKTGAGRPGNGDYWENDVTAHLFVVPLKTTPIVAGQDIADSLMPIPYTDSCGSCHDSDLSDD